MGTACTSGSLFLEKWVHIPVDVKESEPVCCDRKFFVLHSFTRRLECWHLLTCFHSAQLTGSSSDAMKLMCKVCSLVSTPVAFISDRRMTQCVSCGALPGTVWRHMRCRRFQTEVELLCGFKCSHLNLLDTWIAFVGQTLCLFAFLLKCVFSLGIYNAVFVCSPQSLLSYSKSILVGKRRKLCMLAEK